MSFPFIFYFFTKGRWNLLVIAYPPVLPFILSFTFNISLFIMRINQNKLNFLVYLDKFCKHEAYYFDKFAKVCRLWQTQSHVHRFEKWDLDFSWNFIKILFEFFTWRLWLKFRLCLYFMGEYCKICTIFWLLRYMNCIKEYII